MNNLTTGIAVALALAVIVVIFIFPSLWPFGSTPVATPTPTATTSTSELQVTDVTPGTGATAMAGDLLTVDYVGTFTDGSVFDASANHNQHFSFILGAGDVIPGWDQGLVGMKEGGTRRLVIPPELAYGASGAGNVIPPNSTLIFTVQLISVQKATTTPAQ